MTLRIILTVTAAPEKGGELAQAFRTLCQDVMQEPGCEQFEVFRSELDPDKLVLIERWRDQAALDAHSKMAAARGPMPRELRAGPIEREDYAYSLTR